VLKAAGTKWNFLPFKPGLVGGHCIGVDPYYLAHKAQEVGYNPEIILAGRRLNDNMGIYVANQVIKLMIHKGHAVENGKVLVLGLTFKEECPDIRNSKVIDVIAELKEFGCAVSVADYWADAHEVKREYGLDLVDEETLDMESFSAIVVAVGHKKYKELTFSKNQVVYDVKSVLKVSDGRL
jgi:UDP-N-acetyl-D-glucosamine/UDP-N-acetyl-D-galactosamine dehydrogenase